jgi:hypothetical protein
MMGFFPFPERGWISLKLLSPPILLRPPRRHHHRQVFHFQNVKGSIIIIQELGTNTYQGLFQSIVEPPTLPRYCKGGGEKGLAIESATQ